MTGPPEIDPAAGTGSPENRLDGGYKLQAIRPTQSTKPAPCGTNCPAGGRVREWVGFIAQHARLGLTKEQAYRRAWEAIVDRNPFPATMGRVCPHPCESECNRVDKDGAVAVNEMERFLGDWAIGQELSLRRYNSEQRNESVGVVGAGPAGLSFAYQMARRGYSVVVYDKHEHPGGMLRFGIPDYRLPPSILDAEIRRIADLGVDIQCGVRVGEDIPLQSLRERHDVLFVGIGAQRARDLPIPGGDMAEVRTGTEYLFRTNQGEAVDLGPDVVVVGGGNTAIDAARTARRRGAKVTVLYRRTRNEMPAAVAEITEAEEEGVAIEYLAAPTAIRRTNSGQLLLTVQQMRLGDPDPSGRGRPIPVPGSSFEIEASAVVAAIAQEPDWEALRELNPGTGWVTTDDDGQMDVHTYAGGDVRGPGIASIAIGQGRAAAEAADARLRGVEPETTPATPIVVIDTDRVKLGLYQDRARVSPDHAPVQVRLDKPGLEITQSMTEEQFLREAERCLSCGSCFGCQHCWMYCNAAGFTRVDDAEPGDYFMLDLTVCEGCGKCIDVCPTGYLSARPGRGGSGSEPTHNQAIS